MSLTETLPAAGPAAGAAAAKRVRRGLVLALACAAQAMIGLDMAIVNVAMPSIQSDLGVSRGALQWIVVAYGLLLGGFLLFGGRLTDQLGRRRIFLTGVTIFSGASLLAGSAQHGGVLIAARAVQGFGAALIAPAALSLLAVTFTEGRERNRAVAIFGAVGGVSGSVGVVASGLLTAGPGWRWAFLINVPAGVIFIVLAVMFLVPDRPAGRTTRLDITGASTVTGGLLLFVYGLHHASTDGWVSVSTLALFAAAAGLLGAFARIEARSADPLVPVSIRKNRGLMIANLTAFLANSACLSFIFIGSLLMQQGLGYSPIKTGLAWLATTATMVPTAMVGAKLSARMNIRWLLVVGLSLFTAGALWLTRIPADAGYATGVLPAFLCAGLGFGLAGPALQIGALAGVSASDSGLASGLVETMREIGGAAGVAAVSTVLVSGTGLSGFHTGFVVTAALSVAGLAAAGAAFVHGARGRSSIAVTADSRTS